MVQEEQERCSNISSGGGRFSKKLKQKKIPQRGLGVAQLEKIRLEEQQKKDSYPVFLPLPHQSSSIPFPPPLPTNLSSTSSSFRSPPSNFDLFIPSPPPSPLPATTIYGYHPPECSGDNGGSGYSSYVRNPCELEGEVSKLDPRFNHAWPWNIQRQQQQQQQQQQPSSMVNVSTSSSSGLNFQIEPPSNQSYYSNYTTPPMWPEEEKMVGMKRPWPFSLEKPPGSSFNYKLPHLLPPISRLDESSSYMNGGIFNFYPGNAFFREDPSNSAALSIEWRGSSSERNSKKGTKEVRSLDGKFLTLGPPPSSSSSSSKAKQPLVYPAPHHLEFPEFNMLPNFPVYNEDPFFSSSRIVQQQPLLYSFFPSNGQQIDRLTSKSNNQRREVGEGLDLKLRL